MFFRETPSLSLLCRFAFCFLLSVLVFLCFLKPLQALCRSLTSTCAASASTCAVGEHFAAQSSKNFCFENFRKRCCCFCFFEALRHCAALYEHLCRFSFRSSLMKVFRILAILCPRSGHISGNFFSFCTSKKSISRHTQVCCNLPCLQASRLWEQTLEGATKGELFKGLRKAEGGLKGS